MKLLSRRALDGLYAHEISGASGQLLASKHALKFHETVYQPGEDAFVGDVANFWRPSRLRPAEGLWERIWELVQHLFPVESERNHILDLIAFHVRNPGVKIRHALMIRGPQGSGKNTLFDVVLRLIVGIANFRIQGGSALTSRFNSELVNIQVLVIDEVMQRDGYETANSIKALISELYILFEAKGESRRQGTTPRFIVILSNDETPLPVEDSDRRYFVPDYGRKRLSPSFYAALHQNLAQEVPAFLHYLLQRDLTAFSPTAPPPMTAAKQELQRAVRPPLERQLREWADGRYGPFINDIVLPQNVAIAARQAGYTHVTELSVTRALKEIGGESLGQLSAHAGAWAGRPRCWAIRNVAEWRDAGIAAWTRHMTGGRNTYSPHTTNIAEGAA